MKLLSDVLSLMLLGLQQLRVEVFQIFGVFFDHLLQPGILDGNSNLIGQVLN